MIETEKISDLEKHLNNFNLHIRQSAFSELLQLTKMGKVDIKEGNLDINMHCHTFFSFNAYGYSPTSLVWLAKKNGWKMVGMVDFDVLDGIDEFLQACEIGEVRGTAGIETRVFIPEFSNREINSPGEPGVAYHMGIGFSGTKVTSPATPILKDLRNRAVHRNQMVIQRVNSILQPVTIDYETDVLPLSPSATPTERHIVLAYIRAVEKEILNLTSFWSEKLQMTPDEITGLLTDSAKLQNQVRSKLMKRGGPGYVMPTPNTFPSVEEFHNLILECGALPCFAWLDGTSKGEEDIDELLELMIDKGVVTVNIIPDRNWNIPDDTQRQKKVKNLNEFINLAQKLDLPINVGTEMNSYGNKLVDDFKSPELAGFRSIFLAGAFFVYGHTMFERNLGLGYQSEWAQVNFPSRRQSNDFYTRVGQMIQPGEAGLNVLKKLNTNMEPSSILRILEGTR